MHCWPSLFALFAKLSNTRVRASIRWGKKVLKLRFPLKNAKQNEEISEGIAEHMLQLSADCPVSGTPYKLVTLTPGEQQDMYRMDNFMGSKVAEGFLTDPAKQCAELIKKTYVHLAVRAQTSASFFFLDLKFIFPPLLSISLSAFF